MENMEIIYLIVTAVGFIIIGCHQHHYIKTLKGQLDSQNNAIENLKMHVDIFEPEKVKEFVKMREITFKDEKNKEIDRIKSEMEEKLEKSSNTLKSLIDEYGFALNFIMDFTYYVQPDFRQSIWEEMPDSETKKNISKFIDDTPYYRDEFKITLSTALIKKNHKAEVDLMGFWRMLYR